MLRRISISSILISLVLLTLASVTVFAQSSNLQSITIAGTDGTTQKGLIIEGTSTGQNGIVWSTPSGAADSSTPASNDITFTGSDGNILRGIILTDLSWTGTNPNGIILTDPNGIVWSGPNQVVSSGDSPTGGSRSTKGIILTDPDRAVKGIILTDPSVSLRGIILVDKSINLNGIVWSGPDGPQSGGDAATTPGDIIITGTDGSEYKGIILTDDGKNGIILTDPNGIVWSGPNQVVSSGDSPTGGSTTKGIILVDRNGAIRGFMSTGGNFKGVTFADNDQNKNGIILTDPNGIVWSNK